MEKLKAILIVVFTVCSIVSFAQNSGDKTYTLNINVNDLRNSTGVVQFSLYNVEGSIPDEHFEKYFKVQKAKIIGEASSMTFDNLPEGNYAVNILHDENENGKTDKGMVLPVEGIGFSNYTNINLFNRPKYSKAKFELKNDKTIQIQVIYM